MTASKVNKGIALLALIATAAIPTHAQGITGIVVDAQEKAVSGVEISVSNGEFSEVVASGEGGAFESALDPPLTLTARKSGFGEVSLQLEAGDIEVVVEMPLAPYADELVVSVRQDSLGVPRTASLATLDPSTANPGTSITDLLSTLPSVAQNGQGGLLQVFSIRGLSRHRVLTHVDGVRIVSDRRAGAATSFADPHLVEGVEVLRGPASTRFGSGALGGIVQIVPRANDRLRLQTAWESEGSVLSSALGWGESEASFDIAFRKGRDSTSADGQQLFSRYRQVSGQGHWQWGPPERNYRLRVLGSLGRDIGKVTTDFPERTTIYPEENHIVGRFVAATERRNLNIGIHPHRLVTEIRRDGELSTVTNRAFDWNLAATQSGHRWGGSFVVGADAFGRSGVRAREQNSALTTVTLDGRQSEVSLFATWDRRREHGTLSTGARVTRLEQDQQGSASEIEASGSAFVGWAANLTDRWDWRVHGGTGWRFPSLSERFFRGTTGRGQVIGNPDLEPERSWTADVGLRWTGRKAFAEFSAHHTVVDDYIERIDFGEVRRFENVESGSISGAEISGSWHPSSVWTFNWGGHVLDGDGDNGAPLADIPSDRLWVESVWSRERWAVKPRFEQRLEKSDTSSGELPLDGASLLSVRVEYSAKSGVWSFFTDNALDETYRNAADDKLPAASGRSFGVAWAWEPSFSSSP